MHLVLLFLLSYALYGDATIDKAEVEFANYHYEKAFKLYSEDVQQKKDPKSAYKLGWMYENGKGVPQNEKYALVWYKQASEWEMHDTNRKKVYETVYANLSSLDDSESANTLLQKVNGKFSLRAYEPNYLLVTYSDVIPHGDTSFEENGLSKNPDNLTYIHTELQYQISLRADYMTNWFGFAQMWSGAYTQTSYWQIFLNSAPFRETNYKPELFVTIPFFHKADVIGFKGVAFGYKHSSNGQAVADTNRTRPSGPRIGSRSRSWNRLYTRGYFQWENLFMEIDVWHKIKEKLETDDNPDIEDYYGSGSLELGYIHKKLLASLLLRPSFSKGWVSTELSLSYPTHVSKDVYLYLKAFSGVDTHGNIGGYGSSLIDYDQKTNMIGFGLSISR